MTKKPLKISTVPAGIGTGYFPIQADSLTGTPTRLVKSVALPRIERRFLDHPSCSLLTVLTELFRLFVVKWL
jgi:hypothetical protein